MSEFKRCARCGHSLPLTRENFCLRVRKTGRHQWQSYCRPCTNAAARESRVGQGAAPSPACDTKEKRARSPRLPLLAERAARGEPLFPLPAALVG